MEAFMSMLFGGAAVRGTPGVKDLEHGGVDDPEELKALIHGASQPRIESSVIKSDKRSASLSRLTAGGETADQQQHGGAPPLAPGAAQQQQQQQQPYGDVGHRSPGPPAPRPRGATGAGAASVGGATGAGPSSSGRMPQWALTSVYGVTNLSSVVMIVVANKMVLFTHKFGFAVTLTWLHAVFTAVGMAAMAAGGVFPHKSVPWTRTAPIAAVYVGFVVFNNLSIQLNPLGFYQLSKLGITPVLVAIEWLAYGKTASPRVLASIALLLVGITLCTVTDTQVSSNPLGMAAAAAAVVVTSLYQVWAGTKQKELGLNGMQLLQQVSPVSVALLALLIPLLEPVGWRDPRPGTILGYDFTPQAVMWIVVSSALGLVVTLSTFLFIGATSSLTYNVVGHLKTVLIVGAGVVLFGDEMGSKKLMGLASAMAGIVWYSHIKMEEARKPPPQDSKG